MVASCVGATTIGFSAIFFALAGVPAATGALFRCLYALPALVALAFYEQRGRIVVDRRPARLATLAGVAFAADLIAWHHSVDAAGAGLGTVLGQSQVLFMTLFTVVVLRQRLTRPTAIGVAVVIVGVVCVSGLFDAAPYGDEPALGVVYGLLAGAMYVAYLLLLRAANTDPRQAVTALLVATMSATVVIALAGAALGELSWPKTVEAHLWLVALAFSSQVVGWLLISSSIVLLPPIVTSLVLSLQPACAVVFSMVLLSESPTPVQLLGGVLIAAGFAGATARMARPSPGGGDAHP
jgi:drug/metabolite transporter (DMT)-like permease